MVNNYSNILVLLQSKIDESINNLSDSKIKSPNDYILDRQQLKCYEGTALKITLTKIMMVVIDMYIVNRNDHWSKGLVSDLKS